MNFSKNNEIVINSLKYSPKFAEQLNEAMSTNVRRNGGSKGAALISFILNIKTDFDYLSFTSQCHNNSE
jgi:hypothetical protein